MEEKVIKSLIYFQTLLLLLACGDFVKKNLEQERAQVQMYRWLGGPLRWSGHMWKILYQLGFEPQIVQSVVSHYTNYDISEKLLGL
jgi:hypothetical protein